jgi:hypothetical protein
MATANPSARVDKVGPAPRRENNGIAFMCDIPSSLLLFLTDVFVWGTSEFARDRRRTRPLPGDQTLTSRECNVNENDSSWQQFSSFVPILNTIVLRGVPQKFLGHCGDDHASHRVVLTQGACYY